MQLRGTSVLITGGASGLGAQVAREFAAAGARVAVLDVNLEKARLLASEIGGFAALCDVTSTEQVQAAIDAARDAHGAARVLINCAGIGGAKRLVGKNGPMPLEDFTRVINVNLVGTFNVMRLAAPDMLAAEALEDGERGVIVNTTSVAAFDGQIGQAAYAASKGGVVGLTLPVARDLAPFGIRVMTIAPGIFWTPMMSSMPPAVQEALGKQVPFPSRMGKPEEYAQLVHSIIANPMLNGEVIRLDGAIRMPPK
jgi:NAD(P)-dependent dehydrogenase (short-subunit alcohol dehydrogenase family)